MNPKYCWIFFTEKCNLDCEYCFYKFRDLKSTLTFEQIKTIIDSMPSNIEFVFSGGEPFAEWNLLKKSIEYIRKSKNSYILIQSNGVLINEEQVNFLKENKVNIEIGLDGLEISNIHRKGINTKIQNKILENIKILNQNFIHTTCTMTVHPSQCMNMLQNIEYLISIGLNKIEVTPAIFEKWDENSVKEFKRNYLLCLKHRKNLIGEYDIPSNTEIDYIIDAKSHILPNWCWLSLTNKKDMAIGQVFNDKIILNKDKVNSLLSHSLKGKTYREKSTILSKYVYENLGREKYFENYNEVNKFIKKINQKIIVNKTL
tara:strand:+ start:306 stop:1250 length:945 start_codon:yes stop_codon:yes gene_type:complete